MYEADAAGEVGWWRGCQDVRLEGCRKGFACAGTWQWGEGGMLRAQGGPLTCSFFLKVAPVCQVLLRLRTLGMWR